MHLETERLLIRPWRFDEAPRVLDIMSRPEVMKWLGDATPDQAPALLTSVDEAYERIARWHSRSVPPLGLWAVEVRESGVPAGSVALLPLPHAENGEVEVGWWLHPDSQGKGYATEAAAVVLDHAFRHGLPHVTAVTHLGNEPSMHVARKLGMRHLGVVHTWYASPSECFRITRAEHAATVRG